MSGTNASEQSECAEPGGPLLVFFPTRFHIFDQLSSAAFDDDDVRIYSIYPNALLRRRPAYARLASRNRTLWLGLLLRSVLRAGERTGSLRLAQLLRQLYIGGCAWEFRLRAGRGRPGVVMSSAGYLGASHAQALLRAKHRVVVNHGSLYERYEGEVVRAHAPPEEAAHGTNWAHDWLVARMDAEFALADRIVVCSPTARDTFPPSIAGKLAVVPLGAPLPTPRRPPTRHGKGTVFLHVSNLSFRKNVGAVIDAFRTMRDAGDSLVIGGPISGAPALKARINRAPDGIAWLGRLDPEGVQRAMREADVFVHPSLADGWAMAVTEALAAGLPVVASPKTGAATYYAASGLPGSEAILLADSADPADIARCMRVLRDRLKENPDLQTVRPMTWAESAAKLSEVLAQVREERR